MLHNNIIFSLFFFFWFFSHFLFSSPVFLSSIIFFINLYIFLFHFFCNKFICARMCVWGECAVVFNCLIFSRRKYPFFLKSFVTHFQDALRIFGFIFLFFLFLWRKIIIKRKKLREVTTTTNELTASVFFIYVYFLGSAAWRTRPVLLHYIKPLSFYFICLSVQIIYILNFFFRNFPFLIFILKTPIACSHSFEVNCVYSCWIYFALGSYIKWHR